MTLDSDTDIPMSILVDPSTGQVRGILRDMPQADAAALAPQAGPDSLDALFSRGIPDAAAWNRWGGSTCDSGENMEQPLSGG